MLALRGGDKVRPEPLPPWPPALDPEARTALLDAVAGGAERSRLTRRKSAFEEAFAAHCGTRHAIGVNSGATALDLALESLALSPDAVVVAADYGHPSTVRLAAERHRLRLLDIDPDTLCLSPDRLAEALARGDVGCVILTHVAGQIAHAPRIVRLCAGAGVPLIEDAAHAHGAALRDGRRAGCFGTLACFSLHDTKTLPAGEGGVIVLDDDRLADRIRLRHDIGRRPGAGPYDFAALGGNHRLSEAAALLAQARLTRLDADNARRHAAVERLRACLPEDAPLALLPPGEAVAIHPHHVLPTRYRPERCEGASRQRVLLALSAEGIPCSGGWPRPLRALPGLGETPSTSHPATDRAVADAVWIDHRLLLDPRGPDQIVAAVEKLRRHASALQPARRAGPGSA